MSYRTSILLISVSLAACSPLPRQAEALAKAQACCSELSELKPRDVELSKPSEAVLSESSPSFAFPEGKSYLAAFRLPALRPIGRALLKTHRTGFLVPDSQIFCPSVTYLKSNLEPLRTAKDVPVFYEPPGLITNGFWYSVLEVPPEASVVLVHTSSEIIGRRVTLSGTSAGYSFFTGKSYVYVPGGQSSQSIPCGQTGRVELEVR